MKSYNKSLLITGAFGYLGSRIVNRLMQSSFFSSIICTDIIKPAQKLPPQFFLEYCDIRDGKTLTTIVTNYKVTDILHLAYLSNPTRDLTLEYEIDVVGFTNVMKAAQTARSKKLVIASSDCVYGFFPDTPDYLDETAPMRPTPGFSYAVNKIDIENKAATFARDNPGISVVILRPCIIMGPHCKSAVAKSLSQPLILGFKNHNPIMQFIHEDDAAEAFYLALTKDVTGIFNVAADEGVRYDEMAVAAKKPLLNIPARIMKPLVHSLYTLHILPFGTPQLAYIQHPLSMNYDKIKTVLNFTPRYSSTQAIQSYLESL